MPKEILTAPVIKEIKKVKIKSKPQCLHYALGGCAFWLGSNSGEEYKIIYKEEK